MPKIKALAGLKDGLLGRIVDSQDTVHGLSVQAVTDYIGETPSIKPGGLEMILKSGFSVPGCVVRIHCFTIAPLKLAFNVSDKDAVIEDNWWEMGKD